MPNPCDTAPRKSGAFRLFSAPCLAFLAASLWVLGAPSPRAQEAEISYRYSGSIPLDFSPAFLDVDYQGRLLMAGRNLEFEEGEAAVYAVEKPALEFVPRAFESGVFKKGFGYAGVASDAQGNVYVTADTGDEKTCFIKKFRPDLTPDRAFGVNGERREFPVRPRGCAALGDYLLVAFAGGFIHVFDAATGDYLYLIPGEAGRRVRDIAIEANAQQIFGAGQGGVYFWSGGTLDNARFYKMADLKEPGADSSPLEGVAYHPYLASIFHVSNDPPQARSMLGPGSEVVEMSQLDNPHLRSAGDLAFTPDYQVLYVSDPLRQAIHYATYKQAVGPPIPRGGRADIPMEQAGPGVEGPIFSYPDVQTEWYDSLVEISVDAASREKTIAIYFRHSGSEGCAELERGLFAGSPLFQRFPGALWMRVDVERDPEGLAREFGVFRTPSVALFNGEGELSVMLAGDQIAEAAIQAALDKQ